MISLALTGLSFGKMAESTTRGDPSKPKTPEPRIIYQERKRISRCCDLSCPSFPLCDIYLRLGLEKDKEIRVLFDMGRERKRHTPARVECCCSWVVVIAKRSRAASTSPAYIYSLSKPLVVYISPIVLYIYV